MLTTQQIIENGKAVLIGNYARQPVVMARGEGAYLWDTDGKKYLDLFAGFGGSILGHCHPSLVAAASRQIDTLWHVGNTFYTQPQIELAEWLNRTAFKGQAFFCHSGLEANEAAVKLARLRGQQHSPKKWKVVSLNRSFHGRSMAMIAATGNPAVKAGFDPQVPGFTHVDLGDLEGLSAAADPETAAILVEPIQGEGGIYPLPLDYAIELRKLCDARNITLIFDEVWTGCGRTGKWFGHQHLIKGSGFGVQGSANNCAPSSTEPRTLNPEPSLCVLPDIMTLGKAIGGGLPVGAMFAKPEIAALLVPGKHGCTLGANPVCMAVAVEIFNVIETQKLLAHAHKLGEQAISILRKSSRIADKITEVRGRGLFLGIELKTEPQRFVEKGLANGIVINITSKKVIRLAPPINISEDDWNTGLNILIDTITAA